MNATGATAGVVAHGQIGRGRRAWSQLWQVPTFYVGLLAFLCVAASSPFRAEMREGPFAVDLRNLRERLHDDDDPQTLIALGDRLLGEVRRHPRREGETNFLAGSAYYRVAESQPAGTAHVRAIEYLERALVIGVPEPDVPALHHRLGVLLYRHGDDLDRAVQLMAQSIEKGADEPLKSYALLVEAYQILPEPDLGAALAANQKMLELTDDPAMLGQARYLRAELLLRSGQRLDALKELDRITGKISGELRVKTRLLQARIAEDEGLYHRAAASWKELLADADDVPGGKARILLSHGHCLASADPPNYPAAAAAWQQALELGGSTGQAAGLRLGELRLFYGSGDRAQALPAWTEALKPLRTVKDYQNPHLELGQARVMFEHACRHFLDRNEFERAQETAELFKKLAAPGVAEEHWAQAVEAQANVRLRQAGTDKALLEQAHGLFHKAAVAYEQAALVTKDRDQLDACWRAGQCYLAAKDLAAAAAALERFVTFTKDDSRLAEAWFALAETQGSQGQKERARQAYYKCMEFPATPFAWRARYQLAVEEIERKNFAHAKDILQQNLTITGPGMDREAHEKSIYKMAGLMLQMRAYDEAIRYLKEAARQYPDNPRALDARDRLADCYHVLAKQTQQKIRELEAIKLDDLAPDRKAALEELKAHQHRTRRQWLGQAIAVAQELADELIHKAAKKPLTPEELIVVRRACFGMADMYFELNDFTEALRRYQRLQRDYAKEIESLYACNSIWKCVGVMVESSEQIRLARSAAQQSIKIARADLEAIALDHPGFNAPGAWTRANWLTWIEWVESQLNPPPMPTIRPSPLAN